MNGLDGLSAEFRKKYLPDFDKIPETLFQLLGIKADKENNSWFIPVKQEVKNIDRIYDPFTGNEVDIYYSTGTQPSDPRKGDKGAARVMLGEIAFTKAEMGQILFRSTERHRARTKHLCEFLWLSSYNQANKGKDFHLAPQTGYIFTHVNSEKKAENLLLQREKIMEAQKIIDELSVDQLNIVSNAIIPNSANMSVVTRKLALSNLAQDNPDRIKTLATDQTIQCRSLAVTAESKGILYWDPAIQAYRYKANDEVIVSKRPGQGQMDSLVSFLVTPEGLNHQSAIRELISVVDQAAADALKNFGLPKPPNPGGNTTSKTPPRPKKKAAPKKKAPGKTPETPLVPQPN